MKVAEILAVDIGNTTVAVGMLQGQRLIRLWRLETYWPDGRIKNKMRQILRVVKKRSPSLKAILVCSVVPRTLKVVRSVLKQELRVKTLIVGKDIKVPMRNYYHSPWQVGQDRLVGAYAARELYGVPAIVVDFGTAITFDVVSATGAYCGGLIVPGIRMSADSLFRKTALLPKIKIRSPGSIIGKDTHNSILSGLFYGFGALTSGLIDRLGKSIQGQPRIVITGGHTGLINRFIAKKISRKLDEDLVMKGLSLLYQHRKVH